MIGGKFCLVTKNKTKGKIMAKAIPDGYHTVTPHLIVADAAKAIDFYKKAFGATELLRMPMPDGRVGHAEIKIGDSLIMLADEHPEMGIRGPQTIGGTPVGRAVRPHASQPTGPRPVRRYGRRRHDSGPQDSRDGKEPPPCHLPGGWPWPSWPFCSPR